MDRRQYHGTKDGPQVINIGMNDKGKKTKQPKTQVYSLITLNNISFAEMKQQCLLKGVVRHTGTGPGGPGSVVQGIHDNMLHT